ncbi:EAL domain-containing protein (putative c-di-GMP-specific phosphodiesterase class I) [Solirubrobacter pauli]|uniref:EAL domain-containing protein (Putative c-di-GMP-specific phosphodiesterase class I) n=1 Tax=Solirubrobacter pauli TaxID=166793 RepID=A0A660LGP0_9ACTN|nr:EAL domain-containing protein [Solirubrobacter pauli]RKQ93355.1 EAL domain-containing protein (putative c-di-GMP-specific phosphodiesterase class I) [Solirubrobacter pauli]
MTAILREAARVAELRSILDGDLIRSVYQPIVDLDTHEVVGYEALARGPVGSSLERPDLLFACAREHGLLEQLEWACRAAALRGALDARLRKTLFVNVEPSMLDMSVPVELAELFARATRELDVVIELTERALTDKPAEMLARVAAMRTSGLMMALDDVGADRRSLALMPFVNPEVIKLDLRLVQENPSPAIAAIVHAVNAEAERSGAVLLAEGIETEEQLAVARALGARYGQGWLFGRPAELPTGTRELPVPLAPRRVVAPIPPSPYRAVAARVRPRRGTKGLLLAISKHLEAQVAAQGESAVVFAAFQEARHFTPRSAARYEQLATSAALVGALGVGLSAEPVPGVRGADLDVDDALAGEWNVTVVAPHFAAAFVARDLGDTDCPDMERRFDFCLTYDRDLAVEAARGLLARIAPR